MNATLPRTTRNLAAVVASGALVVAGLAPMPSAAAASASAATAVTLTSTSITGVPTSVAPGYHTFVVKESAAQLKKDPRGLTVLQLAKGYTTAQLGKDAGAAFASKWTPAVRKAYTRAIKNTRSLGGLELDRTFTTTGKSFTVLLTPGTYVLDNGASEDGAPDSYKTLVVAGTTAGAKPKTVGTISSKEFAFKLVGVKAGKRVYALHDAGAQLHMYFMVRLDKGHTLAEIEQALSSNAQPPAWVHPAGFAGILSAGQTMYTTLTFKAGSEYLLACFMPDVKTGTPHAALGMVRLFTVT